MFAWKYTTWNTDQGATALPMLDTHTTGMMAGTKVASRAGWVAVEKVEVGQEVLTFDGGLQPVVAITRHVLMADMTNLDSWPLHVPAGALGNRDDMSILPHQPVMIESDVAEDMTGDPFALVPAGALDGFRGITQTRPTEWVEVIQLHFAQDEIVFANIGALFLCRAEADLTSDLMPEVYDVLSKTLANDLVDCLMVETAPTATAQPVRFAA